MATLCCAPLWRFLQLFHEPLATHDPTVLCSSMNGMESPLAPIPEYFDVLIIGAGLSGIDAAHHLQKFCPGKSYAILEQRERIGGTWDLFRYPGIWSDSDMLTMGYSFRPWTHPKAISPGEDIREYITATALDEGIDRHIRFRHQIRRASWSSQEARWTVEAVKQSTSSGANSNMAGAATTGGVEINDEAVTLT